MKLMTSPQVSSECLLSLLRLETDDTLINPQPSSDAVCKQKNLF